VLLAILELLGTPKGVRMEAPVLSKGKTDTPKRKGMLIGMRATYFEEEGKAKGRTRTLKDTTRNFRVEGRAHSAEKANTYLPVQLL